MNTELSLFFENFSFIFTAYLHILRPFFVDFFKSWKFLRSLNGIIILNIHHKFSIAFRSEDELDTAIPSHFSVKTIHWKFWQYISDDCLAERSISLQAPTSVRKLTSFLLKYLGILLQSWFCLLREHCRLLWMKNIPNS